MPKKRPPADQATAAHIPFEAFRDGLPQGRFRVIVNPDLAPRFVAQRVNAVPVAIFVIGIGIAFALSGKAVVGALIVTAGILFRRAVKWQAPTLLLQMASRLPAVYADATSQGVMEVRQAAE
jgi:hypothetical protein